MNTIQIPDQLQQHIDMTALRARGLKHETLTAEGRQALVERAKQQLEKQDAVLVVHY